MESNELLAASDCTSVPWIPLTPTLLLPYHLDFERIPLTFCPRNKRIELHFIHQRVFFLLFIAGAYDIEMIVPEYRKHRHVVTQKEQKKKRKIKKKNAQRRKKKKLEQSKE